MLWNEGREQSSDERMEWASDWEPSVHWPQLPSAVSKGYFCFRIYVYLHICYANNSCRSPSRQPDWRAIKKLQRWPKFPRSGEEHECAYETKPGIWMQALARLPERLCPNGDRALTLNHVNAKFLKNLLWTWVRTIIESCMMHCGSGWK